MIDTLCNVKHFVHKDNILLSGGMKKYVLISET